jgi:hypothetical protein
MTLILLVNTVYEVETAGARLALSSVSQCKNSCNWVSRS